MARHRFSRVIRIVVLVGIIQLFAWAEHPTDLQSQVSAPENLTVHSYNFNTTLYWDYQRTKKTLFQVEFRSYEDGTNWTIFDTCKNIVQSYCDLSTKIDKPGDFYYMRVKALEGSDESDFSKTKEFSLRMEGRIGPPTLDVYMMDKEIVVDIWHAPIPDVLPDIWHFYPDFDYKVHYMKTNQIETNICDDDKCTIFFTPPKKNENYCFSAQGISNLWAVTGEMSTEICLFVEDKDAIADFRLKVAVGTSLGIFLILLIGIVIYIYKKTDLNTSKLPGALMNFASIFKSRTMGNAEQNPKYCIISAISSETSPDSKSEAEHPQMEAADHSGSSKSDGYAKYQMSMSEEQKSEVNNDSSFDDLHSGNKNSECFHTKTEDYKCSLHDSESLPESSTEEECSMVAKRPVASYGYDKPQVPLHLVIEMNKVYGIDQHASDEC